jgi:hypothetical protein
VKVIAWTLGYPPAYDVAVRLPGNAKAPGGYAFRTKRDALHHVATHADAAHYRPYAIELDRPYEEAVTRDFLESAVARHAWHRADEPRGEGRPYMAACGICVPRQPAIGTLDHDLLLIEAPFVRLRPVRCV